MLGVFGAVFETRHGRAGMTLDGRGGLLPAVVLRGGCTAGEALALVALAREACGALGAGLPCVVWSESCGVEPHPDTLGLHASALSRLDAGAVLEREAWERACEEEAVRLLEIGVLRSMLG